MSVKDASTAVCTVVVIAMAGYGLREYVRVCRERTAMLMASNIIREVRETIVVLQHSFRA
tara:strand:+ start:254 stop:433 length:180 start_codon:yes stop_codon:yes gene_type:complete